MPLPGEANAEEMELAFLGRAVTLVMGSWMLGEHWDIRCATSIPEGSQQSCISDTQGVRSYFCPVKNGSAWADKAGYESLCKIKAF